tara:strand:- start:311 stop:913 length:603 start_codon:yes stop_codon:yes gene_type:complete
MSRIIVDAVRNSSAGADGITLASDGSVTLPGNVTCSGTATGFGGGKLVNYAQTVKTDTFSQSLGQGAYSNNCIELSYAAASSSNKLFIMASLTVSYQHGQSIKMRFSLSNSVIQAVTGDAASSRDRSTTEAWNNSSSQSTNLAFNYLHSSPSTSAATYGCQLGQKDNGTQTVFLNRNHADGDYDYNARSASTLTIMEFSA